LEGPGIGTNLSDNSRGDSGCGYRKRQFVILKLRKNFTISQNINIALMVLSGIGIGIGASFSGLGGGFLTVPLQLFLGYSAQKAVGTSFLAILVLSLSAIFAHNKLANIDYRTGLMIGIGGIIGAQIGARLVEHVSTANFKKIFAAILIGLAMYLFFSKN
jgi:uncharacterized membrane protein YfcA